jgi:glutamate N-acetyltransferase/amino-acid N-acetyltransferase
VSAVGDCCGNLGIELDTEKVEIRLGGEIIFAGGILRLDPGKERRLSEYLKESAMNPEHKGWPEHEKTVDIDIIMGMGRASSIIIGSDLTHEYVRENADYRT